MNLDADINSLDRADFQALFDSYLNESDIRERTVVTGRVIEMDGDWVTVDVGYKAEGIIPLQEFIGEDGEPTISVGDSVDVYLDTMNEEDGQLRLSKRRADECGGSLLLWTSWAVL